ncbi:FtsX-like permease family protein [Streptomyces sp. S.PB5]|uniref:FtsX-like permease family protein n=1 Tax=Streptomyces sp. S.PB5 TaxID=3020844 RepID=UPI0025AEE369|nr:FtsX-like permease family protein [Streptomyces sp. S.PB5]MDN3023188.1 FtsX-like permease family protein [Streptomyces sp. S.PB5]
MLSLALRTLRTRWSAFTGSFVALSLGVALLTVMGLALASSLDAPALEPERFSAAPVVVKGQDTLRVPTPIGDRVQKLAHPRPVPTETVASLRRLGRVTQDRTFAVRDDVVGHPWSTAAFAPYELTAGRAPRAADEVVATDGLPAAVGQRMRTAHGVVRVVGTVSAGDAWGAYGFESAFFFTDARAAELAPVSTQLVVESDAAAVRRVVDGRARVLTGDARRLADADPERDAEALTTLNALFGTAGGVTGFVSVFVVASTFAFAVAQRRREFGLLRTVGATPGQLRRTVLTEALVVGILASAAGCALGAYAAPWLAEWVVDGGLAPSWFAIGDHVWPYQLAFWTGLSVAVCGALAASWRAGRTAPTQALREAAADERPLTRGRLLCGTALLVTATVTCVLTLLTDPGDLLHRKTYVSRPMLLITATALLAPALVRPLTGLLAPCGFLVRSNAGAALRRTAAVAAPVLVTVALTGSLLGATATLNEAKATEARLRTVSDFVVTSPTGLSPEVVRRLRALPDTEISATASSAVYVLEEGVALIRSEARAADPRALAATVRLPLTAGRVTDLDDDSIIVNEEWAQHEVGRQVTVRLGDGTRRSLRIAAVMPVGTGDNGVYVTPANARGAVVDRVEVKGAATEAELRRSLAASDATLLTRDEWLHTAYPTATFTDADERTRLGLLLVLGIVLLYTGISLANTLLMATSDRAREFASLRLAGATTGQVLRLVAAEAALVVAVGAVLGLLVTALNLGGMWGALGLQSVRSPIRLPWTELAAATGACAVLAVISAVVPAGLALRQKKSGRAQ